MAGNIWQIPVLYTQSYPVINRAFCPISGKSDAKKVSKSSNIAGCTGFCSGGISVLCNLASSSATPLKGFFGSHICELGVNERCRECCNWWHQNKGWISSTG